GLGGAVVRHAAEAARPGGEEGAVRWAARPWLGEGGGLRVATLHDHAVAGSHAIVARRAEDVVSLLAAGQHRRRDGDRRLLHELATLLAREIGRLAQRLGTRDRAVDQRTRAAAVGEEGARRHPQGP